VDRPERKQSERGVLCLRVASHDWQVLIAKKAASVTLITSQRDAKKKGLNPTQFVQKFAKLGTGLGLWVCKEIAERHRGNVQLSLSKDGGLGGAVFTVFLPYAAQLEAASGAA